MKNYISKLKRKIFNINIVLKYNVFIDQNCLSFREKIYNDTQIIAFVVLHSFFSQAINRAKRDHV